MEPGITDPLPPPSWSPENGEKDDGVIEYGWWTLVDGVWRWMTDPLPKTMG